MRLPDSFWYINALASASETTATTCVGASCGALGSSLTVCIGTTVSLATEATVFTSALLLNLRLLHLLGSRYLIAD